jgi:hypothetical protein
LISLSFFEGIEVLALHVLNQSDLKGLALVKFFNNYRHLLKARPSSGSESPLACDDLIFVVVTPNEDRLKYAKYLD